MKTSARIMADRKLMGYFRQPQVYYTHLDNWYMQDMAGYLSFLTNLKTGIRELLEGMLLQDDPHQQGIHKFLFTQAKALTLLELEDVTLLLQQISCSEHKVSAEELKSELYYQIYFIIESVNAKIAEKKRSMISSIYQ
jgi:hypothetical protein